MNRSYWPIETRDCSTARVLFFCVDVCEIVSSVLWLFFFFFLAVTHSDSFPSPTPPPPPSPLPPTPPPAQEELMARFIFFFLFIFFFFYFIEHLLSDNHSLLLFALSPPIELFLYNFLSFPHTPSFVDSFSIFSFESFN